VIGTFTSLWNRVFAVLGRVSMYRLALVALAALALIAFAVSFFGLVGPTPLELVVTLAVLSAVCVAVDAAAQAVLKLPWRLESSLITAHILLFVLRPTLEPAGLAGIALAAAVASLSKYVLAWRGRHIFNPAAVGATVLTVVAVAVPALGASAWWVGTPVLALPVIVLGLAVLVRTEKVRVIAVFLVIAVAVGVVRTISQYQDAGLQVAPVDVLWSVLWSSPFLFLGAFMLSEPLTMPPRRWQQFTVAAVVGVLAGWPIDLGAVSLGQERALLVGNAVAFAFA
jgi:Na+-transporting NADH:ubiquinone oxidoreductase subunit NqrB